jgi:hypothetical protein
MCSGLYFPTSAVSTVAFRRDDETFLCTSLALWLATFMATCFLGCAKAQPLPADTEDVATALTEAEIRDIAATAAEQAVTRIRREEQSKAEAEQRRGAKAASEDAQSARQAAEITEEQAAIEAVNRSEQAYWLLVPSERRRVDSIRERIRKEGLARLDHEDVQWAWQGDGQECLKLDMLTAADKQLPDVEADTASLQLTNSSLIEFYCLDPLEQLRRLQLAKRLVSDDTSIPEEIIIEFRHDPFLATLVSEYMLRQRK